MRRFIQACYRLLLGGIGCIGLGLLVIFTITLIGGSDTRNHLHPLPITALGVLAMTSLALAGFQRRLPDALVRPSPPIHLAALLPLAFLATCITPIGVMITLTGLGLEEEVMRPLSVGTALLFILLYMAAGIVGLILALWPTSLHTTRPARQETNPFDRVHLS